jgi:hypothetical protein
MLEKFDSKKVFVLLRKSKNGLPELFRENISSWMAFINSMCGISLSEDKIITSLSKK